MWELPPGKPDRRESFKGYGVEDDRFRVTQSRQKGPTCSYYGFLPLRVRIGPFHGASDSESRTIEKAISLWRKQVTACAVRHPYSNKIPDEFLADISHCDRALLTAFGINPIDMFISASGRAKDWNSLSQMTQTMLIKFELKLWDDLPLKVKRFLLQNFVIHTMMMKYQLQPSKWTPDQPIKNLIQILKNYGPMAVAGNLGISSYSSSASCSTRKIAARAIYYFPEWSKCDEYNERHVIILIGAEKLGDCENIYYNDPNDSSCPVTGKRIYVESYKTFTAAITSPFIIKTGINAEGQLHETPEAYGVHAHPTLQPKPKSRL